MRRLGAGGASGGNTQKREGALGGEPPLAYTQPLSLTGFPLPQRLSARPLFPPYPHPGL